MTKCMNACDSTPFPEALNILLHYAVLRGKNAVNTSIIGMFTKGMHACDRVSCSGNVKHPFLHYAVQKARTL